MKQNKRIETIIYGVAGAVFAVAFFFSIMYPEYRITQQFYPCDAYEEELPRLRQYEPIPGENDRYRIVYASYFYDCFKSGS